MLLIPILFFALLGLVIGSFLNVVIIRSVAEESLGGRSHCRSCQHTLRARELVPVASFFLQGGRCRHCRAPISWQYPFVEVATAFLFAHAAIIFLPFLVMEPSLETLIFFVSILFVCVAGVVALVADLRFQIIPNGAALTLAVVGFLVSFVRGGLAGLAYDGGAAIIISAFLGALWLVSRGKWLGLGDAKLIFGISLLIGYPAAFVALLFAFWLGGAAGIILMLAGGKKWGSAIPFGPFILAGAIMAYGYSSVFFALLGWS
ncbi:MAG: prepilin peptidase [bacterium]|nr:prepilin peptidase [bacterium]MDZ4299733.1 prepilin peptidase [Candidatus Sungbacteria bacterium]